MRKRARNYSSLACVLLWFGVAAGMAQQGHPLTGTWTGDWGSSAQRTPVTIVMNWDGKKVNGVMNPGPDSVPLASVYVDVANWTVRMEADSKQGHVMAEGKLEDLGSYHRTIKGTWHQGSTAGDFRITRE
jgi:hypothetical protein